MDRVARSISLKQSKDTITYCMAGSVVRDLTPRVALGPHEPKAIKLFKLCDNTLFSFLIRMNKLITNNWQF